MNDYSQALLDRVREDGFGVREPVLFYRSSNAWGIFSNFAATPLAMFHPFSGERVLYRTGEHRYQAMKATTAPEHDYVIAAPTAYQSKDRGRSVMLRDGWGDSYGDLCWYVMMEVVRAKARQNSAMRAALKATGDRPLYEDSPTDDIWGVRFGDCYKGKNLLGRCLMAVRDEGLA